MKQSLFSCVMALIVAPYFRVEWKKHSLYGEIAAAYVSIVTLTLSLFLMGIAMVDQLKMSLTKEERKQ